jgi:hypothetical protein
MIINVIIFGCQNLLISEPEMCFYIQSYLYRKIYSFIFQWVSYYNMVHFCTY